MPNRKRFDKFIIDHLDNAHNLAKLYVKTPEDVEDVVAESVEKAYRSIHALKDPEQMRGWFNRIVINTSINHLRKQSKILSMNKDMPRYHVDDFSRLEFEDLLNFLPEKERKIVSLRFCDKYELKEIAETLEMNENTVKTVFYRSLKKLRLAVDEDGYRVDTKSAGTSAKALGVIVLAVLLSATLVFNLSPTLAAAAYDIPVIGDIVRVITFNRFAYLDKGYEAEINVPQIQGLLDPELQAKLNAEFSEYADDLIISFEESILGIEEIGAEYRDVHGEPAHMSIKADYEVKTDNDRVLSLDTFIYSDVGNFVLHKFYTIDKKSGTLITLPDLFKSDADYITPISIYLKTEMERMNSEENGAFMFADAPGQFGYFCEIKPDNNFYVSSDGKLVICFDKYEVAAGYVGSPEFVIPADVIADIATTDLQ